MTREVSLEVFLKKLIPIYDVRSPSEYKQGHIPQAISLPLFSDEERVLIGTLYKKEGKQSAAQKGLALIAPKIDSFVDSFAANPICLHCWRGGMRSQAVAQLLEQVGYRVTLLKGGYKTYRRWVLDFLGNLELPTLTVIGGLTGTGKTAHLHNLAEKGEQVLDLEALACHRGSAFGSLPTAQPTQEQFENRIASQLHSFDLTKKIWVEDESRLLGKNHLPQKLFDAMQKAPLHLLEKPLSVRIDTLVEEYASHPSLILATQQIAKKLGGERTAQIIEYLEKNEYRKAAGILLSYYDKTYLYAQKKRRKKEIFLRQK